MNNAAGLAPRNTDDRLKDDKSMSWVTRRALTSAQNMLETAEEEFGMETAPVRALIDYALFNEMPPMITVQDGKLSLSIDGTAELVAIARPDATAEMLAQSSSENWSKDDKLFFSEYINVPASEEDRCKRIYRFIKEIGITLGRELDRIKFGGDWRAPYQAYIDELHSEQETPELAGLSELFRNAGKLVKHLCEGHPINSLPNDKLSLMPTRVLKSFTDGIGRFVE